MVGSQRRKPVEDFKMKALHVGLNEVRGKDQPRETKREDLGGMAMGEATETGRRAANN